MVQIWKESNKNVFSQSGEFRQMTQLKEMIIS